jgi:Ser/Thr protein kinase RdoA (MazF antagonist)
MTRPLTFDPLAAARAFDLPGAPETAVRFGSGHINDTFAVSLRGGARVLLQRINTAIFKDPDGLMENVGRVTRHLGGKLVGLPDAARRALTLLPTRDGDDFLRDEDGNVVRMYVFVEGTRSVDAVSGPDPAYQAAKAFASFQRLVSDLAGPRLVETIPAFHDTRRRFRDLVAALERDAKNRAADARDAIEFALSREPLAGTLLDAQARGDLAETVTHNDTKVNNVLLDEGTGEGLCVVDLDTVMPGLFLYDFGDLVRTAAGTAAEDERDLSRVKVEEALFLALVKGTLDGLLDALSFAERDRLVLAGKVITYECGMRFLADHLDGDTYFRVHRPGQNLDRARAQFALVRSLEEKEERLLRLVERLPEEPARP